MVNRPDTSAETGSGTSSSESPGVEVRVANTSSATTEIATSAQKLVGSLPSGIPLVVEQEGVGYVFSVKGKQKSSSVVITLDVKQLADQAKVRRINNAMRRARRR